MHLLNFFFSSRRRHTRSLCDWSSDVCSSDLIGKLTLQSLVSARCLGVRAQVVAEKRSEERRVGKECRCLWLLLACTQSQHRLCFGGGERYICEKGHAIMP